MDYIYYNLRIINVITTIFEVYATGSQAVSSTLLSNVKERDFTRCVMNDCDFYFEGCLLYTPG